MDKASKILGNKKIKRENVFKVAFTLGQVDSEVKPPASEIELNEGIRNMAAYYEKRFSFHTQR
jgi:hypothetical protein